MQRSAASPAAPRRADGSYRQKQLCGGQEQLIAIPVLSLRWKAALPAHGIGTLQCAGDAENSGREEREQHRVIEEELAQLRELRSWV